MAKVEIDTPGVTVRIESDDPLEDVSAKALALFHEAGGWPQYEGSSAGFASAERRGSHDASPSSMWDPPRLGFTPSADAQCDLRPAEIVNRSDNTGNK